MIDRVRAEKKLDAFTHAVGYVAAPAHYGAKVGGSIAYGDAIIFRMLNIFKDLRTL